MDSAQKAFEVQAQVRHNAEDMKRELSSLYSWEKDIKEMEQKLKNSIKKEQPAQPEEVEPMQEIPKRTQVKKAAAAENSKTTDSAPKETTHVKVMPLNAQDNNKTADQEEAELTEEKRRLSNALKLKGNSHVQRSEYDEALDAYTEAITIYPDDPVYFSNRALCYLKLGRYDDCVEDCENAIDLDTKCVKAYYRRMQANEFLGNDMDALKDCTTVLMIDPKNAEADKSLQRINERLRRNALASESKGPRFTPTRRGFVDILPIEAPYVRSTKPLRRVPIADVIGPKDTKNYENSSRQISDEEIDKLFNSNCGPYVEVKKSKSTPSSTAVTPTTPTAAPGSAQIPSAAVAAAATPSTPTTVAPAKPATLPAQLPAEPKLEVLSKVPIVVDKDPITVDSNKLADTEAVKPTPAEKKEDSPSPAPVATPAAAAPIPHQKGSKGRKNKGKNAQRAAVVVAVETRPTEVPIPPAPTSTGQFYSNWKELSNEQRYRYLKAIGSGNVCRILGAGLDSDTLADVLNVLHDFYVPHKDHQMAETLLQISKNNQIAILSLLLTAEERKVLNGIINAIKENKGAAKNAALVQEIVKNFNLN